MTVATRAERSLNVFNTIVILKCVLLATGLVLMLTGTLPVVAWRG